MEITSITINKWESFQPRKDRANHTWFRVENTIAFSETLHGLSADQKWFWICLLAYASKKNSGEIAANWSYFETTFGVTTKRMKEALISIEAHGAVTLSYDTERLPLATDRWTNASLQTDKQTNKQTDIYVPVVSDGPPAFSASDLLDVWNSNCGTLPKARELGKRAPKAQARVREKPDRSYWVDVVSRIAKSNFCNGRSKGSEWRATFDFLVQPDTHLKVLEGKYDNRDGTFDDTNWDRVFQKSVTA